MKSSFNKNINDAERFLLFKYSKMILIFIIIYQNFTVKLGNLIHNYL